MRILFAHNKYLVPGGEDQSALNEARMLRDAGHDVFMWEVSNDALAGRSTLAAGLSAIWSREACRTLAAMLEAGHYDLMHVQNHFPLLSPAIHRVAAARGVATVQHLRNYRMMCVDATLFRDGRVCRDCAASAFAWRGVAHGCYRGSRLASLAPAAMVAAHRLAGTWENHVDAYVAVSGHVRDLHEAAGFPASRIHVRANLAMPANVVATGAAGAYIVAAARLAPEKGLDVLIRAWRARPRAAKLFIAGSGSGAEEARLGALAGGDPSIAFEGQLAPDRLIGLMAGARAVVNPALWMEPFGRTPVEAFSVGTPAIVSRIGGLADIVEDQVDGLVVAPGDVAALDGALTTMLADHAAREVMAQGARQSYARKFAPSVLLPATEAIYAAAIARRRALARPAKARAKAAL